MRWYPESKPIDLSNRFVAPLKEANEDDRRKFDKFGRLLAQQGEQRVSKATSESLANTVEKLSGFISVSGQELTRQAKVNKEKVFQELGSMTFDPDNEDNRNTLIDYRRQRKNILKNNEGYTKLLAGVKDKSFKAYLQKMSPKEALYAKEFFARRTASTFARDFRTDITTEGSKWSELFKDEVAKYAGEDNVPIEVLDNFKRAWAKDKFGTNLTSDGLLFDSVIPTLDEWIKSDAINETNFRSLITLDTEEKTLKERINLLKNDPKRLGEFLIHRIGTQANIKGIADKDLKDLTTDDFKLVNFGDTNTQTAVKDLLKTLNI